MSDDDELKPFDHELIVAGFTLAGACIERGTRDWTAWSAAMLNDIGEPIRPYLRGMYESIRHYPGLDTTGMSTAADIDRCETVHRIERGLQSHDAMKA